MIAEIGKIVIDKIETLPFMDKYAGVIKQLAYNVSTNNKTERKTFPADCRVTFEECESGRYTDLIPDSKKKSVLYLEETGALIKTGDEGNLTFWRLPLNLVCWLNLPLLGSSDCYYSAIAIQGILSRFPTRYFNSGIFQRVKINVVSQRPKNENPFSKYSYESQVMKLTMFPYDYFVLQLEIEFVLNKTCLFPESVSSPIDCP